MKTNTLLLIGAGALAAYLLMPEKIKEITSGGSGGGGPLNLDLSGIFQGLNLGGAGGSEKTFERFVETITPGQIGEAPGGMPDWFTSWLKDIVPESADLGNIDITPDIPGSPDKGIPDIIERIIDLVKPAIPDVSPPGLSIIDQWNEAWKKYTGDFGKGLEGGIEGFSWATGGWQKDNSIVGWFRDLFFKPGAEMTDYARNILRNPPSERSYGGSPTPEKTGPSESLVDTANRMYKNMMVPKMAGNYKSEAPQDIGGGFKRWGTTNGIPVISKNAPGTYPASQWAT